MDRGVIVKDEEPSYHLEKAFAQYFNVKRAVAVMNGSWAGMLSLFGLGVGPGDEVIVPANTDYPVANQVVFLGAKPVFVDCELDTQNIDPAKIEEKITSRTKVITVVHMMGHPTDMDPVMEIARKHDLFVVEDSCHSLGAKYKGKLLPIGDLAYNSFHGKQLWTAGGGAMVYTNNEEVAEKILLERYHGSPVLGCRSYILRMFVLTEPGSICMILSA
jgi:perosamine synthetase